MASKVIKVYSGILGKDFLYNVIGTHVISICSKNYKSVSFEIDPEKLPEGQAISSNLEMLKKCSLEIFTSIRNSLEATPL